MGAFFNLSPKDPRPKAVLKLLQALAVVARQDLGFGVSRM